MTQFHSAPRRQGVILLIVVIMLALFLVVGLSFMLYAESEATASRIYREAFTINYDRADIETNTLLNYALGQLIYDVKDDIDGCDSSMHGPFAGAEHVRLARPGHHGHAAGQPQYCRVQRPRPAGFAT